MLPLNRYYSFRELKQEDRIVDTARKHARQMQHANSG